MANIFVPGTLGQIDANDAGMVLFACARAQIGAGHLHRAASMDLRRRQNHAFDQNAGASLRGTYA